MYEPNETAATYAFAYLVDFVTNTRLTGDEQLLSILKRGPQTIDQVAEFSEFTPITVRKRLNVMVSAGQLYKAKVRSFKDQLYHVNVYYLKEHQDQVSPIKYGPKRQQKVRLQSLQIRILKLLDQPNTASAIAKQLGADREKVRRSLVSMSQPNELRDALVIERGMDKLSKVWEVLPHVDRNWILNQ
jgi:predicted transcriptional regulator